MAIKGACRWKPDIYKTSLETTVANLDPTATPPTGSVVMTAQLVGYDDTKIGAGNPYAPGASGVEQFITVLYEEPITKELSAFEVMSQAQATAEWAAALDAFKTRVLPAGPLLLKAIRAAKIAAPILIN